MMLPVVTRGYLVPTAGFLGTVHSVFARACNIRSGSLLLTLAHHDVADGPTTLRLARGDTPDLRTALSTSDRVRFEDGRGRAPRMHFDLRDATVWRPPAGRPPATVHEIGRNLACATAVVARCRARGSSVIDREGASVVARLEAAYRRLDARAGSSAIESLIGWGEGLTPAGDDFVVGWCAASTALATDDAGAAGFQAAIAIAIERCLARTTAISAHALRLAAQGHFSAPVHGVCDAVLHDRHPATVEPALARLLAIGATSGADTAAGVLARIRAWLRPRKPS